jgi:hypothetical protein
MGAPYARSIIDLNKNGDKAIIKNEKALVIIEVFARPDCRTLQTS